MKTLFFSALFFGLNAFGSTGYDIWPSKVVKGVDDRAPIIKSAFCDISFGSNFIKEVSSEEQLDKFQDQLEAKGWNFQSNSSVMFTVEFVPHEPNRLSPNGYPEATLETVPTGGVERLKFHKKIALLYTVRGYEEKFEEGYGVKFFDYIEESRQEVRERIMSDLVETVPSCETLNIL
ncbi:MAG: hypothetical protein CME64_13370 [Halobacteriovoraceae bacterium]|nr:hypothetical protein [Halobacteriovoraceae bacterium]|tara:strand:+ start:18616 stop:19146 length:531 start_codon:yes stop_codon:yes gene_type:complete